MNLGVARDKLKNGSAPETYRKIIDNTGTERMGIYITGRHDGEMQTDSGWLMSYDNDHPILDNYRCCYNPIGDSGQSGSPVYVRKPVSNNPDYDIKTVFGIGSGGRRYNYGECRRIDTNILHFVYNNPNCP